MADRRPEVEWFADAMERKLRDNDHKRHWRGMTMQYLSMRLTQERKELYAAIASGDAAKVLDEAADVANFAMMVADLARHLYGVGVRDAMKMDSGRCEAVAAGAWPSYPQVAGSIPATALPPGVAGTPLDGDELRRLLAGVGVVGNIDGYPVIRRSSVLELVNRRISEAQAAPGVPVVDHQMLRASDADGGKAKP